LNALSQDFLFRHKPTDNIHLTVPEYNCSSHVGSARREKEISNQYQELSRVEIYCANCAAGVILDVTKQFSTPEQCRACLRQFPKAAADALAAYTRFHRETPNAVLAVQFRDVKWLETRSLRVLRIFFVVAQFSR